MSIADKLTYLNGTKSLLREAINAAGGNLTQETPFREYAGGWLRDQSASLNLDFSKQQYVAKDKVSMFPDRVGFENIVTFTRSTGGGRFNAQGQYEWVGPDEPRIDYDPVTGECLGLLVEEQRTNLVTYSSDFGASRGWALAGITRTANAGISPDGTSNAWRLTVDASGANYFYKQAALTPSTTYTGSVYIRNVDCTGVKIFMFEEGTGISKSLDVTSQVSTDIWTRVQIQFTTSASGGTNLRFYLSGNSTGANTSYLVFGAQLEAGAFPTTYIPTTTAQVTRAADIASVNELSPWYNSEQGTWYAEFQTFATSGYPTPFHISDDLFPFTIPTLNPKSYYVNGRGSTSLISARSSKGKSDVTKLAVYCDREEVSMCLDGGAVASVTRPQISETALINLGRKTFFGVGGYINGHIRSIRYFSRRLSDTELQEITS